MEIIERKSEPLKIGFPTNSRIAQDCAPLREALELEGRQGLYRSRFVPDAVFREARVRDIARFLRKGIFSLGICGDDIAIEEGLENNYDDSLLRRILLGNDSDCKLEQFYVDRYSCFAFLRREEDGLPPLKCKGIIVTSYPRLARKFKIKKRQRRLPAGVHNWSRYDYSGATIRGGIDGQIEAIVRNDDIPGLIGGMGMVRSESEAELEEYGLSILDRLMVSSPSLWRKPKLSPSEWKQTSTIRNALRERLERYMFPQGFMLEQQRLGEELEKQRTK